MTCDAAAVSTAADRAAEIVDVILRDGGTLRLRPPVTHDVPALVSFFGRLSPESLYMRFHGARRPSEALVEPFVDPDWAELGALVGELDGVIVALASWARLRDPAAAEVAFTVADEFQGRGIGTRLLEQLAARAAAAGIERFVAEVLPSNDAMLSVFTGAGFEVRRQREGGEIEVEFPIAPTAEFLSSVDARDHEAVVASLRAFFDPAGVAVIGASQRKGSIGGELFRNVLAGDYDGAAYPVNRGGEPVAGVHGYTSVEDVPDPVELAVICLPATAVLQAAEQALRRGVRALVVISAGFAETGADGIARQDELLALVRAHGARLIGPNCLGLASAASRLNATFAAREVPPGSIGFSSQSGALGLALLEAADSRGLGLSSFVSIGNKADVSSNDLLEWWEDDPATSVVLLYVESFGNPRRFARVARRVARRKPVLALKSGTSATGRRAASSHTAALASSEAAVDALFHQAGVTRAATLEELVDLATLLSGQPEPPGRRVGILSNAGGLGILCADACDGAGLEVPELADATRRALGELLAGEASTANPVDMLGGSTAADYEAALPLVLADPGVDAAIVLFVPTVAATADDVADAIESATVAADTDKPVLAVIPSGSGTPAVFQRRDARVTGFAYPESAARALGRAAERSTWLRRPHGTPLRPEGTETLAARALVETALADVEDVWLESADARALLAAYGIPLVPERVVATAAEAAGAARELGYPVVVKTALAGAHKTESGGVALDLRDADAVFDAGERIGGPLIVQPMVRGGVEVLAGVVQDPVFGPLVAFGPGGVLAELIGEASFRIAPLTDVDARELVEAGKVGRLVRGFRGAPPADADALVDLLARLACLGDEVPEVAELDLNPVLALENGCLALDARVRVRRHAHTRHAKSW